MKEDRRTHLDFDLSHSEGRAWIAGVDEAGRGCLAGPVVAGAVLAGKTFYEGAWCAKMVFEIDDSKKLSPEKREAIFNTLPDLAAEHSAYFATGMANEREIDSLNILGATKLAMSRALEEVGKQCEGRVRLPLKDRFNGLFETSASIDAATVIVDGLPLKAFPYEHTAYVGGDGRSLAIGLASVIAKVTRDRMMCEADAKYPNYGFARHKGYGTAEHRAAILKYGPCALHRRTFLIKVMESGENLRDNQGAFNFV
jgi:ribonuclease HII